MLILIKGITRVLKMNYILINDFWGSPIRRKLLFVWFFTHTQAAIFFQNGRRFHRSFVFLFGICSKRTFELKKLASSKKKLKFILSRFKKIQRYVFLSVGLLGSPVLVLLCQVSWALLYWFLPARFHVLSCVLLLHLK